MQCGMGILSWLNNLMCDFKYVGERNTTPETIIKGKFLILEPNIFREAKDTDGYLDFKKANVGVASVRKVFAGWYYALRNFAIVALLSVLVYVAIRMVISSTSQDKAKYKTMIKDWLVALCLLFAMHYIMVGMLNLSTLVTQAIGAHGNNIDFTGKSIGIISAVLNAGSKADFTTTYDGITVSGGEAYAQLFVLIAVIVYTFIFIIKYMKRMMILLFLILVAPISCITYPIDKISDGKAQAYNKWFQEFFFQVIIQPFHLLIYIVLVGSAMELANVNILYAIMCFAVMGPAEKFVKEMFGIKDSLGSPLGAMATGAAASSLLNHVKNIGKGGNNGNSGTKPDNNTDPSAGLPPRTSGSADLVDGNTEGKPGLAEGPDGGNMPALGDGADDAIDAAQQGAVAGGAAQAMSEGEDSGTDRVEDTLDGEQEQETQAKLDKTNEEIEKLGEGGEEKTPQTKDEKIDKLGNGKKNKDKQKDTSNSKWANFKAHHDKRMLAKYGTMSKGKRWAKRAGRGVKALAKGALIGTVGVAAVTAALATGNTKTAMGIIGAGALAGGKKIISRS